MDGHHAQDVFLVRGSKDVQEGKEQKLCQQGVHRGNGLYSRLFVAGLSPLLNLRPKVAAPRDKQGVGILDEEDHARNQNQGHERMCPVLLDVLRPHLPSPMPWTSRSPLLLRHHLLHGCEACLPIHVRNAMVRRLEAKQEHREDDSKQNGFPALLLLKQQYFQLLDETLVSDYQSGRMFWLGRKSGLAARTRHGHAGPILLEQPMLSEVGPVHDCVAVFVDVGHGANQAWLQ
mmetsp:Transcript_93899/g.236602  ORF Transcript_93899/g.236602 Transcript_93899/m.236602 type:complete len:232 (-) Transcript_93899:94-789(-)